MTKRPPPLVPTDTPSAPRSSHRGCQQQRPPHNPSSSSWQAIRQSFVDVVAESIHTLAARHGWSRARAVAALLELAATGSQQLQTTTTMTDPQMFAHMRRYHIGTEQACQALTIASCVEQLARDSSHNDSLEQAVQELTRKLGNVDEVVRHYNRSNSHNKGPLVDPSLTTPSLSFSAHNMTTERKVIRPPPARAAAQKFDQKKSLATGTKTHSTAAAAAKNKSTAATNRKRCSTDVPAQESSATTTATTTSMTTSNDATSASTSSHPRPADTTTKSKTTPTTRASRADSVTSVVQAKLGENSDHMSKNEENGGAKFSPTKLTATHNKRTSSPLSSAAATAASSSTTSLNRHKRARDQDGSSAAVSTSNNKNKRARQGTA